MTVKPANYHAIGERLNLHSVARLASSSQAIQLNVGASLVFLFLYLTIIKAPWA